MLMSKKVALALGGGGAKFFAHLGMIKVLQENNIPIDYISCSSMGAIAGALIANEVPIEKIKEEFYQRKNFWSWATPSFQKFGFVTQKGITNILDKLLPQKKIENSKIPFSATASDILSGKLYLFKKGDINRAVCASCAFPGIFAPTEFEGKMLVDGGVLNNIPANICRQRVGKRNIVISSSLDANINCARSDIKNSFDIYQRIIYLPMYEKRLSIANKNSNFFIQHFHGKILSMRTSPDVFKVLGRKALESFYRLGYENTEKIIDKIKESVG